MIFIHKISMNCDSVCHLISVSHVEGPVLNLHKVSRLDMGAYMCIATNGVPPTISKRIQLNVDCKFFKCSYSLFSLTIFHVLPLTLHLFTVGSKKNNNMVLNNSFLNNDELAIRRVRGRTCEQK